MKSSTKRATSGTGNASLAKRASTIRCPRTSAEPIPPAIAAHQKKILCPNPSSWASLCGPSCSLAHPSLVSRRPHRMTTSFSPTPLKNTRTGISPSPSCVCMPSPIIHIYNHPLTAVRPWPSWTPIASPSKLESSNPKPADGPHHRQQHHKLSQCQPCGSAWTSQQHQPPPPPPPIGNTKCKCMTNEVLNPSLPI
ncbi:hypothetical protein EX30DRAFT_39675 [Ascodesmis nigricans]|uniref:Uncharacterized protein n=1 Tax=Ascodesmis nigricans TaxID=341454 RepID=A0A4S2MW83_9PEZI|nr:hypothetical protein EX30DRAFT_39675 [Ascodesmis nigricans]